jgi:hypothetical protein
MERDALLLVALFGYRILSGRISGAFSAQTIAA